MGTRFSARPDWPWGPPSLLYNGYRVFSGCRGGRCVGLTPHSHLVPKVLEKSRAIPLLTLRACVAYKKGENLPRKRHCRHCGPHPHLINAYQRPSSGAKDWGPKLTTHLHLVPRWKVMEVYMQPPSSLHGFYRGSFWGAFAKVRKATICFVLSARLSGTHGTTLLPLDGFSQNLIFEYFLKIHLEIFKFHQNLTRITGNLHEDQYTFYITSRSILLGIKYIWDKFVEKNKTYHMITFFLSKIVPFMR